MLRKYAYWVLTYAMAYGIAWKGARSQESWALKIDQGSAPYSSLISAMIPLPSGNFLAVASASDGGMYRVTVYKFSSDFDLLHVRHYEKGAFYSGGAVMRWAWTADSSEVVMLQYRKAGWNSGVQFLRLDTNGNVVASKLWWGSGDLSQVPGEVLPIGTDTFMAMVGGYNFHFVKFDTAGNIIHHTDLNPSYNHYDHSWNMIPWGGDYFVVGGTGTASPLGGADMMAMRITEAGAPGWFKVYGGAGYDQAYQGVLTPDSHLIVVGFMTVSSRGREAAIAKIDTLGNVVWSRTVGGSDQEAFLSVVPWNNGYLAAGYTRSFGTGGWDYLLAHFSSDGALLRAVAVGTADDEAAVTRGIMALPDNWVMVWGGTKWQGGNYWRPFIVVLDSTLSIACSDVRSIAITPVMDSVINTATRSVTSMTHSGTPNNDPLPLVQRNDSVEWLFNDPLVFVDSLMPPSCYGELGWIKVDGWGGAPPYRFQWTSGDTADSVALPAGSYGVTLIDMTGCTDTLTIQLPQPDSLAVTLAFDAAAALLQATVTGGTPPYAYAWSTGAAGADTLPVTQSGTYWVMVTDSHQCTASDTIQVVMTGVLEEGNRFSGCQVVWQRGTAWLECDADVLPARLTQWAADGALLDERRLTAPRTRLDGAKAGVPLWIRVVHRRGVFVAPVPR